MASDAKKITITKLPELTNENVNSIMEERIAATKNLDTVVPMLWQGLLEMDIDVEGQGKRTVKMYIPKNCPQGTTFIFMNTPDGVDAVEFMQKSGWIRKADEKSICLFILEPENNAWKTPEEEMGYVEDAFVAAQKGVYALPSFTAPVVGYGEIGSCLQKVSMKYSLYVPSAVFIDASDVEEEFVHEWQQSIYDIDGYKGMQIKRDYGDMRRGDVPVPVWIISKDDTQGARRMVDYWRSAARANDAENDSVLGTVYNQSEDNRFTPEGKIIKIAYKNEQLDYCDASTTDAICAFLLRYYRYGQGGNANMLSRRINYDELGVVRRSFTDKRGVEREYLVYVPRKCRDRSKKLPMVLTIHGSSQTMRHAFENGQWYRKAEEEGIILVSPESKLVGMPMMPSRKPIAYRPNWSSDKEGEQEYIYFDELLDRVIAEFPVDEKRIYSNGHSNGCVMTNYLATSPIAKRFAAFGGTSGGFHNFNEADKGYCVSPVWISVGEYDIISHKISDPGNVADALDYFLKLDGLATEENAEEVRIGGAAKIYVDGRYHHYVWANKNGVPLIHYNWVAQKAHTYTADENFMFWDQWFSKWSLDENGNRLYEGKPIE